jgi:hypothetical protein
MKGIHRGKKGVMPLAAERSIKDVVTDFLASAPELEALAAYRLPDSLQQWAHDLLEKIAWAS